MKKSNTIIKKISLALTLTAVALFTFNCSVDTTEMAADGKIKRIMEETGAVGLAVAVVKDGEIIFSNTYGYKNLETKEAIAEDDLFRIASISKSFTTTALMTLVEQGKLSLDDDVSDLAGFAVRNPEYPDKVITLKMLLSHTSSLSDSQGYFELDVLNPETNPDYAKCYNDYEPGSQYEYCNLGFNTIGAIVEKYSEERFDNFIRKTVLDPMNLYANFNPDSLDRDKFVTLYSYNEADSAAGTEAGFTPSPAAYASRSEIIENDYVHGYSTPVFSPTGGMKISARGLAAYMAMHMNHGTDPVTGTQIISEESARLMQTPVIDRGEGETYCLALRTTENLIEGEVMTGHTGSAYGLFSAMFFQPEKKIGIVMMTNGCKPEYKDGFTLIQGEVIRALYETFKD